MVVESGLPEAGLPVAGGLVTLPRPVQKMVMNSPRPRLAGRACAPGILPSGAAKMAVLEILTAPCPVPPGGSVNMPGELEPIGTVRGVLVCPPTVTCTEADVEPANSCGI